MEDTSYWPAITMLVVWIVRLTVHVVKHDEAIEQKYNFWHALIAVCIMAVILTYGGFFDVFIK